jgi:hypothetical protein
VVGDDDDDNGKTETDVRSDGVEPSVMLIMSSIPERKMLSMTWQLKKFMKRYESWTKRGWMSNSSENKWGAVHVLALMLVSCGKNLMCGEK